MYSLHDKIATELEESERIYSRERLLQYSVLFFRVSINVEAFSDVRDEIVVISPDGTSIFSIACD
jgi:hypothetical protein